MSRRLDVIAAAEQGHRPGSSLERERAAHRGSGAHARKLARRAHEIDHPPLQEWVDVDVLDGALQRAQVVDPDHGLESVERVAVALRLDDHELLVGLRVAERRLEEEAVELRLGEREDALVVERVLRREDRGTGSAGARDSPSTVICRSAIASSSALWVRGIARLISSTSRMFVNAGPGWNSNTRSRWSYTDSPVTSVGCRSGVHWIRAVVAPSIERAIARASTVLAVPGTSSRRTCPSQSSAQSDELDLIALADHDVLDVVEQRRREGAEARALVQRGKVASHHGSRPGSGSAAIVDNLRWSSARLPGRPRSRER